MVQLVKGEFFFSVLYPTFVFILQTFIFFLVSEKKKTYTYLPEVPGGSSGGRAFFDLHMSLVWWLLMRGVASAEGISRRSG